LENDDLDKQHGLSALQPISRTLTMAPITRNPKLAAFWYEDWMYWFVECFSFRIVLTMAWSLTLCGALSFVSFEAADVVSGERCYEQETEDNTAAMDMQLLFLACFLCVMVPACAQSPPPLWTW
jgi:hypothetical protein